MRAGDGLPIDGTFERLARWSVLIVLTVLDLVVSALVALAPEGRVGVDLESSWWQPIGGKILLLVVVWAVVVRLPGREATESRLLQAVSVFYALSLGWSMLLLVTS